MKDQINQNVISHEPTANSHPTRESNDGILEQLYQQEFNRMLFDMYVHVRIAHDLQRMMEDNYVPELEPKK